MQTELKILSILSLLQNILTDLDKNGKIDSKKYVIEDTYGQYDFIVPNMKPIEAINWLLTYARPVGNPGADMLFYENAQGYFFNSLQSLYKQNSAFTFFFDPKNVSGLNGRPNINKDLFNAIKFEILDNFDTLGAINKGTFANRVITFDVLARTRKVTDFNYNDYFNSSSSMNGSALTNNYQNRYGKYSFEEPPQDMEAGVLRLVAGNTDEQTSAYIEQRPGSVARSIYAENYIPNRVAQIALANHTRVRITVPGNVDVCVGLTADFNVFGVAATTTQKSERDPDPYLSGKYLVTAVRHVITNISYITVIELAKESNIKNYGAVDNTDATWTSVVAGGQK